MILREYEIGKFVLIKVQNEAEFLAVNKESFVFVSSLPESKGGFYIKDGFHFVVDTQKETEYVLDEAYISEVQILRKQIEEAKAFLASTDYKFLQFYEPNENEDLNGLIEQRSLARRFIRENEDQNGF